MNLNVRPGMPKTFYCLLGISMMTAAWAQTGPPSATREPSAVTAVAPDNSTAPVAAPRPITPMPRKTSAPANESQQSHPGLEKIAEFAIDASRETTETVKWVFGIAAGFLTILAGAASFLGYTSLTKAIESVKATANERARSTLNQVEARAQEQLIAAETRIQEHLQACNIVCVSSLETVRSVTVAEQWAETTAGKLATLRDALHNALAVQKAAESIKGLERSYSWAVGMEAYINDRLGKHDDAIVAQLKSIQLASPEKLQTEYHFKYNLACYYVKAGRLADAIEPLRDAILAGGEEARVAAWEENDLKPLRESEDWRNALNAFMGPTPTSAAGVANP